jgi:hypothetical protein
VLWRVADYRKGPRGRLGLEYLTKRMQFARLRELGWRTPQHGLVREIAGWDPHDGRARAHGLVVYSDELAHSGDGKMLLPSDKALAQYPDSFASSYVGYFGYPEGPTHKQPRSTRYLFIGTRCWILHYRSPERGEWRSNCGDGVEIEVEGETQVPWAAGFGFMPRMLEGVPLYAVDTVTDTCGLAYAVDLNTAPQIRGTGLEHVLPAQECYALIADAVARRDAGLPLWPQDDDAEERECDEIE